MSVTGIRWRSSWDSDKMNGETRRRSERDGDRMNGGIRQASGLKEVTDNLDKIAEQD